MIRRLLLLLVVAMPLLWGGAAVADDVSDFPDGRYIYRGTVTSTSEVDMNEGSQTVEWVVVCKAGLCTVGVPESYFYDLVDTSLPRARIVDGAFALSRPGTYSCADTKSRGPVTFRGTVTSEEMTYSFRYAGVRKANCESVTWATAFVGRLINPPAGVGSEAVPSAAAPTGPTSATRSTSQLDTDEADAPSVLSALTRAEDLDAENLLLGAALAVVLVLLVAFPTTLLNSAAESGSDRISTWWRGDASSERRSGGWWWAALGVALAGLIAGFVDPEFGLNVGSGRMLLSILVSFGLETVLGWLVVVWAVRRVNPGAEASYSFKPATLLVVAAMVAFVRVADFEPGIIFGLVAGVAFPAITSKAGLARTTLVSVGWAYLLGLAAWIGYSSIGTASSTSEVFVSETLAAMAIGGMAALPIALFPLRGLSGSQLFAVDKRLWAAAYTVGLASFLVVLMPSSFAWEDITGSLKGWVLIYLSYLVIALLAWAILRSRSPETAEQEPPPRRNAVTGGTQHAASDAWDS